MLRKAKKPTPIRISFIMLSNMQLVTTLTQAYKVSLKLKL
ncbi:hypothetical protein ASZ90_017219 [hydrocarbon metagenome]|uniref:Uncharacterized protein n=1 Tax=hydrocarbon metagenome TaxID=938273 RepID=A0A0W8EA43_9ZZZZ